MKLALSQESRLLIFSGIEHDLRWKRALAELVAESFRDLSLCYGSCPLSLIDGLIDSLGALL
jgi:hypothetical protein